VAGRRCMVSCLWLQVADAIFLLIPGIRGREFSLPRLIQMPLCRLLQRIDQICRILVRMVFRYFRRVLISAPLPLPLNFRFLIKTKMQAFFFVTAAFPRFLLILLQKLLAFTP